MPADADAEAGSSGGGDDGGGSGGGGAPPPSRVSPTALKGGRFASGSTAALPAQRPPSPVHEAERPGNPQQLGVAYPRRVSLERRGSYGVQLGAAANRCVRRG